METTPELYKNFFLEMRIQFSSDYDRETFASNLKLFNEQILECLQNGMTVQIQQVIPSLPHPYLYVMMATTRNPETAFDASISAYHRMIYG